MNTPADRIGRAVEGKPDPTTRVEYDADGKPYTVEHTPLAAVLAGDVVAMVKGLGDRASLEALALLSGASKAPPEALVYQRADQLRAVLALASVPAPAPAPAPEPAPAVAPDAETRKKFNPAGK